MTVTLEDIEKELDPGQQVGFIAKRMARAKLDAINGVINKLKTYEEVLGTDIVKSLLTGKRKLTPEEFGAAIKRFGTPAINAIEAMEHLTKAQKQYLFKRMDWDINEVS